MSAVDRDQGGMVDTHPGSPAWAARRLGQASVYDRIGDVPIPFLGGLLRVSGYLRDELRSEVETAGFRVEDETALSYAPATIEAQPEVQLFLNCRRAD